MRLPKWRPAALAPDARLERQFANPRRFRRPILIILGILLAVGIGADAAMLAMPGGFAHPSHQIGATANVQRTTQGVGSHHLGVSINHTRGLAPDRVENKAVASTGCGKRPMIPAGTSGDATLISGGVLRSYRLHVPRGYNLLHTYPLVLNFHGHGSTAAKQEAISGFSQLADRLGFLVVYPQGLVGSDGATGWASGKPHTTHANDVLFVSDLLTRLQEQFCVNPQRIYAAGFSNGGGMTSFLACALAKRIAAFASVSGSYFSSAIGDCAPGRPVAVLEFHGTADRVVPYQGRPRQHELGALAWVTGWAVRDGCVGRPTESTVAKDVIRYVWRSCRD